MSFTIWTSNIAIEMLGKPVLNFCWWYIGDLRNEEHIRICFCWGEWAKISPTRINSVSYCSIPLWVLGLQWFNVLICRVCKGNTENSRWCISHIERPSQTTMILFPPLPLVVCFSINHSLCKMLSSLILFTHSSHLKPRSSGFWYPYHIWIILEILVIPFNTSHTWHSIEDSIQLNGKSWCEDNNGKSSHYFLLTFFK